MSVTLFCRFLAVLLSLGIHSYVFSQTKYTISGHVREVQPGETIVGASVRLKGIPSVGARTDNYGFYSMAVTEGDHVIIISHVGNQANEQTVPRRVDGKLDV